MSDATGVDSCKAVGGICISHTINAAGAPSKLKPISKVHAGIPSSRGVRLGKSNQRRLSTSLPFSNSAPPFVVSERFNMANRFIPLLDTNERYSNNTINYGSKGIRRSIVTPV